MKQTAINEACKKELRKKACKDIAQWIYDAAIPFNAVNYPSFQVMVESIGQFGISMKAPSFHEMWVPLLNEEVAKVKNSLKSYEEEWAKYGCYIMADSWTDKKQRILINFLVNSPKGTIFMESIDASKYSKTGDKMYELLNRFIERVGEANVVQVVTDNASNCVLAVHVLRLVDGEKMPTMGYIYEAMDKAKEAIAKSFDENEEKYKTIFEIIDKRWESQLHRPLHAAGYYLNPEFFYSNEKINEDVEVVTDLYQVEARVIPSKEEQDKIMAQLPFYQNAEGIFGMDMAIRNQKKVSP
ncbi:hypothetical protein P3X46_002540, partial [Hevea brasiliensis]